MQIDRQVGRRLPANLGQRLGILAIIDRDAHDVGPGLFQIVHLRDRGGHILRVRGRHALHGDRAARADRCRAYSHRPSWITFDIDHFKIRKCCCLILSTYYYLSRSGT